MANPKIEAVLVSLTKEVSENATVIDSAVAYIQGVPGLIQAAVDAADLTPAQEAVFADLNTQLDAKEQALIAAMTANTPTPASPTA